MSAATLSPGPATRDPFMPRSAQRNGPALGLALFAHALLIAALAFGVSWRTDDDSPMQAEVWSSIPQAAAPRAVEPPPPVPVEAPPPPKVVAPTPPPPAVAPPTPTLPDPQIAIEKSKREDAKRAQAEEDEKRRQRDAARQAEADKLKADKLRADKEKEKAAKLAADQVAKDKLDKERADKLKAEKADKAAEKADAARLAAVRADALKRMQGLAGASGGPTDTGTALKSSGPSAGYAGRIRAQIKRNIFFGDTVAGNPLASVEVRVAPDGTIIGKRLLKSSGVPAYDDAVLKAIDRTAVLPRDVDGRVPPLFQIEFKPNE